MKKEILAFVLAVAAKVVSYLIIFVVFWFCISGDLDKILADIDTISADLKSINNSFQEITGSLVGDAMAYK